MTETKQIRLNFQKCTNNGYFLKVGDKLINFGSVIENIVKSEEFDTFDVAINIAFHKSESKVMFEGLAEDTAKLVLKEVGTDFLYEVVDGAVRKIEESLFDMGDANDRDNVE